MDSEPSAPSPNPKPNLPPPTNAVISSKPNLPPPTNAVISSKPKQRDLLTHLEAYLAKRDGVDKLLKICRYAAKLIVASSILPSDPNLSHRLKSFESSVGVSRKAFRLGKFVQDLNALRNARVDSTSELILSIIAYGSEGLYFFIEQFVWLAKTGLIDPKRSRILTKVSAYAELVGYFGSVAMKFRDLRVIVEEEGCLKSSIEIEGLRGDDFGEKEIKLGKLREKKLIKRFSILQDFADGLMALDDILDGNAPFSRPIVLSSAGLLSALISTHKNWVSC